MRSTNLISSWDGAYLCRVEKRGALCPMARKKRNTVYSTDPAYKKSCPRCGSFPCRCPKPKSLSLEQQAAGIRREKKGRGGKTVTVIMDLQLTPEDMKALTKQLKKAVGSGGSVKDGTIEI